MNESQNIQAAAQQLRARETFSYHDVISIGENQGDTTGWFNTFSDLSMADELYLFNQRSRASVGIAYCNLDSPSLFDVGYLMESIGVQFEVPPVQQYYDDGGAGLPMPWVNSVFTELLEDCSLQFFLNQDEKVAGNCSHFPAGHGPSGGFNSINNGTLVTMQGGTMGTFTNGVPDRSNQWVFKAPIEIPRNHTVYAILRFSDFAKDTLSKIGGPGNIILQSGGISGSGSWPVKINLRVTINGTRLVQLRNAQTYR